MSVLATGAAILAISAIGAILLVKRNPSVQQRQAKVLLFGLYFWLIAFIQLFLVAIGYAVLTD
jgi:O-antigen ligase